MSESPVVGIVMGSDSDWPVMEQAAVALQELEIPYEVDVVSAHRMPEEMVDYGRSAAERGLRVIVAGAGGAAHLPGMLASVTPLPVIGVPVPLAYLDGMDSLLSIVQMPAGVPVATVSIGGARNAGLLAARILGAGEGEEAGPDPGGDGRLPGRAARGGAWPRVARCATAPRGPASPRSAPAPSPGWTPRVLDARAGVHDDGQPGVARARGGRLVDHAELEPDGGDAEAVLLGDRLVDDRTDLRRVDEAVDDVDVGAVRDVGERRVARGPEDRLGPRVDGDDAHTELHLEELGDRVGGP